MRNLPPRPLLSNAAQKKLLEKTKAILDITNLQERKTKARSSYDMARKTKWFAPVVQALSGLSGSGELCMYCSSSEASQIDHYRPLSIFPDKAFDFENYLWACDICNRTYKGERFPPDTEPGEMILNPLDDNVWDYFFLDENHGRLLRRIDPVTQMFLPRATSTCDIVGIDRQNVQSNRQRRYKRLRENVQSALDRFRDGTITHADLRAELNECRTEPFQADVSDYFLNGPGRVNEPFRSALQAAGEVVPEAL